MMRDQEPGKEILENSNEAIEPIEISVRDDISLRQITVQDSRTLFDLINKNREYLSQYGDDTAAKYNILESVKNRNATQSSGEKRFGIWKNNELIGFIKVTKLDEKKAEIGYWMGSAFTRKGYMTDSVETLTKYSREHFGYQELIATVHKENKASQRVLKNAGYQIIGENPERPTDFLLQYVGKIQAQK